MCFGLQKSSASVSVLFGFSFIACILLHIKALYPLYMLSTACFWCALDTVRISMSATIKATALVKLFRLSTEGRKFSLSSNIYATKDLLCCLWLCSPAHVVAAVLELLNSLKSFSVLICTRYSNRTVIVNTRFGAFYTRIISTYPIVQLSV